MAKKTRKDKELARLRREVEVLRAQLSTSEIAETTEGRLVQLAGQKQVVSKPTVDVTPTKTAKTTKGPKKTPRIQSTVQSVDPKYIKADLLKSAIFTLIALGTIVALTIIL